MPINKSRKTQIVQNAISNLETQAYDLQLAIRINKKVGVKREQTEKFASELIDVEKKLEAYKEELSILTGDDNPDSSE